MMLASWSGWENQSIGVLASCIPCLLAEARPMRARMAGSPARSHAAPASRDLRPLHAFHAFSCILPPTAPPKPAGTCPPSRAKPRPHASRPACRAARAPDRPAGPSTTGRKRNGRPEIERPPGLRQGMDDPSPGPDVEKRLPRCRGPHQSTRSGSGSFTQSV